MSTPEEWRQNLEKIRRFANSVDQITKNVQRKANEELDKTVESASGEEKKAIRKSLANPDENSLSLMATDVLRTLEFIDGFDGKLVFLRGYLKGVITTVIGAYELAGEDGIEPNDTSQDPNV